MYLIVPYIIPPIIGYCFLRFYYIKIEYKIKMYADVFLQKLNFCEKAIKTIYLYCDVLMKNENGDLQTTILMISFPQKQVVCRRHNTS